MKSLKFPKNFNTYTIFFRAVFSKVKRQKLAACDAMAMALHYIDYAP